MVSMQSGSRVVAVDVPWGLTAYEWFIDKSDVKFTTAQRAKKPAWLWAASVRLTGWL